MPGLRVLCAALLLLAVTLGVPLHAADAHGMAHAGGTTPHVSAAQVPSAVPAPVPTHVHEHGKGNCCPDHHKAASAAQCQLACGAAAAVLDAPHRWGARLSYAVRFVSEAPAPAHGATVAPDPFPPKPSRIA